MYDGLCEFLESDSQAVLLPMKTPAKPKPSLQKFEPIESLKGEARMRRHAMMLFGICLSLAISVTAVAQKRDAKVAADAGAAPASASVAAGDAGASTASSAPVATAAPAADGGAPSTTTAPGAAAPPAGMDGATYAVRLRDLESRVDELKNKIRNSHTRLALLSETVMSGGGAGSRAEVTLRNEMSNAFKLIRALVVMDGSVQYNRQDETGALADQKEIPIFNGSVPPGDHNVTISLTFQGNGYGVFSYLRAYKFEVKNSHAFTAVEGKTMALTITAFEKGGVTTPLDQRPSIEWTEKVQALGAGAPAPAPAGPAKPAAPAAGGSSVGGSVSVGGSK